MNRSEQIDLIAKALAESQVEMKNPGFDSTNPHFRNKFASLASVRNAVIPVLARHGIAVSQELTTTDLGNIACLTVLHHSSGQWMEFGPLIMPSSKQDAQGFGSASTYAKRYSLQSVAGVVGDEDDDAEAAVASNQHDPRPDTSFVDAARVNKVVAVFDSIKAKDLDEDGECLEIFDMHSELAKEPDLYTAVADALAGSKRIGKADWKKAVARGKELAHRSAA